MIYTSNNSSTSGNSTDENTQKKISSFVEELQLILNPHDLHIDDNETKKAETNTLSIKAKVIGLGYPRTIEQLQMIVKVAGNFEIPLYTVSQGKNIGYGEMTPSGALQFIVNLKYLNAIREFDEVKGEILVEPGVTQQQLSNYLKDIKANYWADMTGASPEASIVGNTLEAGFGHTPLGDHRKHILQMDLLLADGSLITTSQMPSIGPDLAQLFVQSNFAIVTAIRIPLYPIPEEVVTFTISFNSDKEFYKGISILSALRKDGTITSLAHTGNSTRALMTSSRFPTDCNTNQILSEKDCHQILNKNSPIYVGYWTTVGGLYGYKEDIKNKQKRIKRAFNKTAKVKFFTNRKMNIFDKLLNSRLAKSIKSLDLIRNSFASLKAIHGIMRGQPSNHPSENIYWRVNEFEKLGLMWHAPVIPATETDTELLLSSARAVYTKYGFEMPVTLTVIDNKNLTAVFNISYDKTNQHETKTAHAAYKELNEMTTSLGYLPYRCGLASDAKSYYSDAQYKFIKKIKAALDPKKIIAPGRYGIE